MKFDNCYVLDFPLEFAIVRFFEIVGVRTGENQKLSDEVEALVAEKGRLETLVGELRPLLAVRRTLEEKLLGCMEGFGETGAGIQKAVEAQRDRQATVDQYQNLERRLGSIKMTTIFEKIK